MEKTREKKKLKSLNSQSAITLIALVVTIIVLLILAGVTIAALSGPNGILTKANQARKDTLDAQNTENATLQGYEDAIDYTVNGIIKITGVDTKITDPEEAMPTGATVIEGDASEGIVIRDENGNEWVWVEVPRTAEVYPTAGIDLDVNDITDEQCDTIYEDLAKYTSAYREEGYEDTFYSTDQAGFADANAYSTAKNNMLRSVYKYGGFWIGRYEVGIENSYRSYGNDYYTEHPITETPVIKANAYPFNYVRCSQAQTLSQQLSTGGKTGSLMLGIQWDLTCKFLETKGGLTQAEIKGGDEIGSTNWGNYSNSSIMLVSGKYNSFPDKIDGNWLDVEPGTKNGTMLLTTGVSEDTKKMNIYDLAGSVWEWTLEYSSNNDAPCVRRGGCYSVTGFEYMASNHRVNDTTSCIYTIGFRTVLY